MHKNNIKIVFLDRDGTVSDDKGYTTRPEDMQIYTGSGRGIALLKQAGFIVIMVTNQSAIGRGYATVEEIIATNQECQSQLINEDKNAILDKILFCPHTPEQNCSCRKPKIGMFEQTDLFQSLNPEHSWMVGDKISDLEFGVALGLAKPHCILLQSGEGKKEFTKLKDKSFTTIENLYLACEYIVKIEGEN